MLGQSKNIAQATLYLAEVDKMHDCIPDYALTNASKRFDLTVEECRAIRDIIQAPPPYDQTLQWR